MMANIDRSKLPRIKLEELKRKEDEERTKEVYADFVAAFSDEPATGGKTFVRGGIVNPEAGTEKFTQPKLYKPKSALFKPPSSQPDSPFESAKKTAAEKAKKIMAEAMKNRPQKPGSAPKKQETKGGRTMSNLEAFKEELRAMQEARDERRKIRSQLQESLADKDAVDRIAPSLDNPYIGTYDSDPNTTNLFLSNLNPDLTEGELSKVFGKYGPLASIKIMWPRTEEERARGYHCGFAAYMTRKDADRAVAGVKGRLVEGFEMKMSWAKPVTMPPHPVYVPPEMLEMTLPPPPSGLPFNAQPREEDRRRFRWKIPTAGNPPPKDGEEAEIWNEMLRNAVVKVVIPTERQLLNLVHRTIEFVIREGPMFEAMIMNRELNNPTFRFLFDNQSPAHVYYRWKLFSMLQGDSPTKWSTKEFQMFQEGSIWKPPPVDFYAQGMPEALYNMADLATEHGRAERQREEVEDRRRRRSRSYSRSRSRSPGNRSGSRSRSGSPNPEDYYYGNERDAKKGRAGRERSARTATAQLTDRQRDKLEDFLRGLNPEREKISAAMLWCVEHADSAEEIVECIAESLGIEETPLNKKIARLYLLSDILANCGVARISNVHYFRKFFGEKLEQVFKDLNVAYDKISARLKAEQFKQRVMGACRAWEASAVYPTDFLIKLQNIFFGLVEDNPVTEGEETKYRGLGEELLDGAPLDENIDGEPIPTASKPLVDYAIDGMPLGEEDSDKDSEPAEDKKKGFVKSKWEELDPETVEKQAMTTSKWEMLEQQEEKGSLRTGSLVQYDDDFDDELDGVPMEDENASIFPEDKPSKPTTSKTSSSRPDSRNSKTSKNEATTNGEKQEMSEERRKELRELEVKVVKYQDDLESGRKHTGKGMTIQEEVDKYRAKLLKKMEEELEKAAKAEKKERKEREKREKESSRKHHKSSKKLSESPERSKSEHKSEHKSKKRDSSAGRNTGSSRKRSRTPKKSKKRSRSRSPSIAAANTSNSSSKHKKKR